MLLGVFGVTVRQFILHRRSCQIPNRIRLGLGYTSRIREEQGLPNGKQLRGDVDGDIINLLQQPDDLVPIDQLTTVIRPLTNAYLSGGDFTFPTNHLHLELAGMGQRSDVHLVHYQPRLAIWEHPYDSKQETPHQGHAHKV